MNAIQTAYLKALIKKKIKEKKMAFTKKGITANPDGSPVMAGPGVNKMNPGYPGFPQMAPSTRMDHSAEISAAQSIHLAGRNPSQKGVSSANHHLSQERRSRPSSMETGAQILAQGAKAGNPSLSKKMSPSIPNAKLKTAGAPKTNKSMAAPSVTGKNSGL